MNNKSTYREEIREQACAIYETIADEIIAARHFVSETWPMLLLLAFALSAAIWFAKPAPPRHVLMGTGSAGGSYEVMTKQYVEFFAENGITLELIATSGAEDNISRLRDHKDKLKAALVQGGLIDTKDAQELLSLGSVDYEPIWFFYRRDKFASGTHLAEEFLSHPMAIGERGSGTFKQAQHILVANDLVGNPNLKALPSAEGVAAFQRGDVSSIMIVDGMKSENVQTLLKDPNAMLVNFNRAVAYTRLMPFFHHLVVPEGALSLTRNFPDSDTNLIATTTNLIIDKNMHPAIQLLFLQASAAISGHRSFFAKYGEFPSFKESLVPESEVAKRYYQKGSPILMDYLPFWIAEFLDRMFFLLLPLFAFAYPILKTMPGYRLARARTRINEVYGELKFLEQDLINTYDPSLHAQYVQRLEQIEKKTLELKVPKSVGSEYYSLRASIDFVRTWMRREESTLNGS